MDFSLLCEMSRLCQMTLNIIDLKDVIKSIETGPKQKLVWDMVILKLYDVLITSNDSK